MSVYLIRHGIAESYAESDFSRELTTEGKIKLREDFEKFKETFGLKDFNLYTSPLVRTRQTAEIFSNVFQCNYEIKEELSAGNRYDDFIKDLKEDENYILIGHEPSISDAIYKFTGKMIGVSRGSIHRLK
ncbi:MAG: SixA phosphatase family protein [Peptoniphilaceae bacterium]